MVVLRSCGSGAALFFFKRELFSGPQNWDERSWRRPVLALNLYARQDTVALPVPRVLRLAGPRTVLVNGASSPGRAGGVLCKIAMIAYRVPTRLASAFAKETDLTSTFDRVADIIAETSEIDRDSITPESHTIDDLGIDSLDFLDIVFAIDKEFGIKIPLEKWTQRVNEGEANTEEYFVMKNLCAKIDELRAAKGA